MFQVGFPGKQIGSRDLHARNLSGSVLISRAFQVVLVVKNLPVNAGDIRHMGSVPGSGRPPEGGRAKPLQYSCLENPMDRGTYWATVRGVAKIWTWLGWLSMPAHRGTGPHMVRSEGQRRQDKSSAVMQMRQRPQQVTEELWEENDSPELSFLEIRGQILVLPNYSHWIWYLDMGGEAFCCEWWFLRRVSEVNSAGNTFSS